ncbi:MAG: c-type cytochrome [Anaerolineae bacterium]|nr:c-type cytochrome [Anaerolineae bacterium]
MSEKTPSFPLGPALVLFGIVGVLLIAQLSNQPRIPPAVPATPTEIVMVPTATQPVQNVGSDDEAVKQGQALFSTTCFACHGFDARGIPGLGKNLVESTFVHDLSDADLLTFIIEGRAITDPLNTTGVAMPARGGNPSLTDDQILSIIAYMRSLQAGQQIAAAPTSAPTEPTSIPGTAAPFTLPIEGMNLATPAPVEPSTDAAAMYAAACASCHGANGEGASASAVSAWTMSDDDIFALLTTLLPADGQGTQHPLYGGTLYLNADQLHLLIDYIHTLPTS